MNTRRQLAMIVCGLCVVLNSACCQTWMQTSAPVGYWYGIASSADGCKLVAIAQGGGGVWTSVDSGNTWVSNSIPTANWVGVASSADGTKLVAVMGYPSIGPIYTSDDSGTTWLSNNVVADWSSVACSSDGNKLLAASFNDGNGGNGAVWTSTNAGLNWVSNNIPYYPPANFRSFLSAASSAAGTTLMVGTYGNLVYISTNSGVDWKAASVPNAWWQSVAASADGTKLVAAVYMGPIYCSTNAGAGWTTNKAASGSWKSVATSADGTKLVAVGFNIYTSTNSGTTWVSNSVPGAWRYSVASSADGNKLATVNSLGGGIYVADTTPTPQLEIASAYPNLVLSWRVPSTNFGVQQSRDLISWSSLTNAPVLNLGNLNYELTLAPSNGNSVFRLISQ